MNRTLAAIARPYQFSDWSRNAEAVASAASSASCYRLMEDVWILAVVESENEFVQIQGQIFRGDVMVVAHNAALEKRPERLNRVGMHDASNVLFRFVIDGFVIVAEIFQVHVALVFVSRDQFQTPFIHYVPDEFLTRQLIDVLHHLGHDATLAGDCAQNRNLALCAALTSALRFVLVAFLPADVRFVHFDDAHQMLKFRVKKGGADARTHIPDGFVTRLVVEHGSLDL